jgi:hypothetical protein
MKRVKKSYNNTGAPYLGFLREIHQEEKKEWRPQKQGVAVGILEAFLHSQIDMAEVKLDELPQPLHRKGNIQSTKQDSFASSFYAWKRKEQTKEILRQKGIDVILMRREGKIALKKKPKNHKTRRKK